MFVYRKAVNDGLRIGVAVLACAFLLGLMARPALSDPAAPPGVDLTALLQTGSMSELKQAVTNLSGSSESERWARAMLCEREGNLLYDGALLGPAGEAAVEGLTACKVDPAKPEEDAWEVTVRLHLLLGDCLADLAADRRASYKIPADRTPDAEIEDARKAVGKLVGKVGNTIAARALGLDVERASAVWQRHTGALQDSRTAAGKLDDIVKRIRDLEASAARDQDRNWAEAVLWQALNSCGESYRQWGLEIDEAGSPGLAIEKLQTASDRFAEALKVCQEATKASPEPFSEAALMQNQAVAMMNRGWALLKDQGFPKATADKRPAILETVGKQVPPSAVRKLMSDALDRARAGQAALGKLGSTVPAERLHLIMLQNLAQARLYDSWWKAGTPEARDDLFQARMLANRSGTKLESLGLYLDALNAMEWEAEALYAGGQVVEEALVHLHAIEVCQRAVLGLVDPQDQGRFNKLKEGHNGNLTRCLRDLRKNPEFPAELFGEWGVSWEDMEHRILDQAKAQTFADLAIMGNVWRASTVPEIKRAEDARARIATLEGKVARGLEPAQQADVEAKLRQARQDRIEALEALLAGDNLAYCEAMALSPVTWEQIQHKMNRGEVMVSYYLWQDTATVEILRKQGPPKIVDLSLTDKCAQEAAQLLPKTVGTDFESVVGGLVAITRSELWSGDGGPTSPGTSTDVRKWAVALNLLYQILVAPIDDDMKAKTIIIVPHGVLHYLPFEALIKRFAGGTPPTQESELTDNCFWGLEDPDRVVAYLPTAGSLYELRSRAAHVSTGVGVVECPTYPEGCSDEYKKAVQLLGTFDDSLKGLGAGKPLTKEDATPGAARRMLESPRALAVFGCHGKAYYKAPLSSCLYLAPTKGAAPESVLPYGEPLDMAETMTLNLGVPVVFLAACETGKASDMSGQMAQAQMGRQGDDLLSLSRAYLIAGSSALVSSLWECDAGVAKDFWLGFAEKWLGKGGCDVAHAVLAARRHVREKGAHYLSPTWWAGFEVHGDPACKYSTD